jgi:hypothetical protein
VGVWASRRDRLIVAWHEVPGITPPPKRRPVGYGVIRAGLRADSMIGVPWKCPNCQESKALRMLRASLSYFTFVKLLFGDAVDATEHLLIYSTQPAILRNERKRELKSGRD